MSTNQVISGNQLCFDQFEGVESHLCSVLNLVKKVGFYEILSADAKVYSKLVEEFYLNSSCTDGEIKTKMKDITLTYEPREFGHLLGFVNQANIGFGSIDTKKGPEFVGYKKKNPNVKGIKMTDFTQDFEFLVDIIEKCILCKYPTHDLVSDLSLQVMYAITIEVEINYGVVIFN